MILWRCWRSIRSRYHRVNVRTTNSVEHSLVEEHHRTKAIPSLSDDTSVMKSTFAILIRTAERCSRIAISGLEHHQLRLLGREPGIDQPPTDNKENKTSTEATVAA